MSKSRQAGVQISESDPDLCLIKALTGSKDLSEFSNLNAIVHLIDTDESDWHMLSQLSDIELFLSYCEYLWSEALELISKQKQNMEAVQQSYNKVVSTKQGKQMFTLDLLTTIDEPHTAEKYPQLGIFDVDEYLKAQEEFKQQTANSATPLHALNIDVLVAEGSIFAAEWFALANRPAVRRFLVDISHEKATTSIQPYQLAVSYIYHLIKPIIESDSNAVRTKDIYTIVKIYWLLKLAKDEHALLTDRTIFDNPQNHRANLPDSCDDFIIRNMLPEEFKGMSISKVKQFYRNMAIKAWVYNQIKQAPRTQKWLLMSLMELYGHINLQESGIRKLLQRLVKEGFLMETVPEESRSIFTENAT